MVAVRERHFAVVEGERAHGALNTSVAEVVADGDVHLADVAGAVGVASLHSGETCRHKAADESEAFALSYLGFCLRVVHMGCYAAHNVASFPCGADDGTYFAFESTEDAFFECCHNKLFF